MALLNKHHELSISILINRRVYSVLVVVAG